jgi:hypothetical protein
MCTTTLDVARYDEMQMTDLSKIRRSARGLLERNPHLQRLFLGRTSEAGLNIPFLRCNRRHTLLFTNFSCENPNVVNRNNNEPEIHM